MKKSWRVEFQALQEGSSDKWEHYFDVYDHVLSERYGEKINFLEIGVQGGGSLEVARRLFAPGSWIGGVDIDPECKRWEGVFADRIFVGSQVSNEVLKDIYATGRQMDVIIDDGSHIQSHMIVTFINLFNRLNEGGIYIIEDTHTNYSASHQDSFHGIGLYDYFKGLSERLNIDFIEASRRSSRFKLAHSDRSPQERPDAKSLIHQIFSIEFYNSMIVIRKRRSMEPLRLRRIPVR